MKRTVKIPIVILMIILGISSVFFACNKEDKQEYIVNNPEILSEADARILDSLDNGVGYSLSTVILPNGEILYDFLLKHDPDFLNNKGGKQINNNPFENLGPQDARNLLISRMNKVALALVDRSIHQYPYEGMYKPAQNGLVYRWGGKDYSVRKRPSSPSICQQKVYGLDCSGFVYQLFKQAGVDINEGPAQLQKNPNVLKKKIIESIPTLTRINVEDLGEIPIYRFESGDIVYWKNEEGEVQHIGMVLQKANGKKSVFQSNGTPGENSFECDKNLSSGRGARNIELTSAYWFGGDKPYGITRINALISGQWRLYLRCNNQTTDAIVFDLEFPTASQNSFEVNGVGTDYDGLQFNCHINLTYDNVQNRLSGMTYITKPSAPSFYRYDTFSVKLEHDETDYFSLVLGESHNAGCDMEGRLFNKESKSKTKYPVDGNPVVDKRNAFSECE